MNRVEFIVEKRTRVGYCCPACDGEGRKKRMIRKMQYVENCEKCHGTGEAINYIKEEYPLADAIKESKESN